MKKPSSDNYFFALRMAFGVLFLYAGASKVLNPEWSSEGFLKSAKTFSGMYAWFASGSMLPIINFMNEWGLTLLGISLLLGLFVRLSSYLGALLMALYYFPTLTFPFANTHYFLVDYHIIFIICLLLLAEVRAGRNIGLDEWFMKTRFCSKHKAFCEWLG
ncbi:MAG: DoxX family membrane protein [bacterium]|nr:DoxX family membrane protein [bacterium]